MAQHDDDRKPDDEDEKPQDSDKESDGKGDGKGNGGKDEDAKDGEDDKPKSKLPLIIAGVVAVIAIIAALIYWLMTRNLESTDDAYTDGRAIAIAAKVSGYVSLLAVDDNSPVKAGQLMLTIDPRDYITARDQARANLALAQAQLASSQVDLDVAKVRAPADLDQAEAQLSQAEAALQQAELEYKRQHTVDQRATTQTNVDQANAQLKNASAAVKSAQAQVQVAALVKQNIQSAGDTVKQRESQVAQAAASLAQAEVNLSYTEIRAPQDGHVTRRNVERGSFLQPGQQVFYIVTPDTWVTANFKENQLNYMQPGQPVDIAVDSYPRLKLHGHVDSIQLGSGDRFSAFPAENATGNYVKIVRRVPVKIVIDRGLENTDGLPLGISVEPTVTVR